MEKLTYAQLTNIFRAHEATGPKESLTAHIVFTEDSFDKLWPLESRTYIVTSRNKAYMPNMGGYSVFGYSLDGTDPCVRLDRYMAAEHGGKDGWKVEYCYLVNSKEEEQ